MSDVAIVICEADGKVVEVNAEARDLTGEPSGALCWDLVGGIAEARGLPCNTGCVGRLIDSGLATSAEAHFEIGRVGYTLNCIPVDDKVVCAIRRDGCALPRFWERLTPRERDILTLVADGETSPKIAERLGLAESTVRAHVQRMRDRLGMPTRAALVARALRVGLIR